MFIAWAKPVPDQSPEITAPQINTDLTLFFFLHCFMSFGGNFVLELLYQEVKQTKLMISNAQLQRHAEIRSIVSQSSFSMGLNMKSQLDKS